MWSPGITLKSMSASISSTRLKTGTNATLIKNITGLIKIVCHQAAKIWLNLSASFTLKTRDTKMSIILNTTAQRIPRTIPLTAASPINTALVDPNRLLSTKLLAYCRLRNFCVNGKTIHANTTTRKQKMRNATPYFGLDFSRVNVAFGFTMRSMRFRQLSLITTILQTSTCYGIGTRISKTTDNIANPIGNSKIFQSMFRTLYALGQSDWK